MPHHLRDRDRIGFGLTEHYRFKAFDTGRLSFVSGVFDGVEDAERAVAKLQSRGFTRDQITVLMSEEVRKQHARGGDVEIEKGSKTAEGLGTGGAIGGAVGAVLGAIVAAGTTVVVPPLGLVIAGPLAAALAGVGAGGATGGLVGALVGAGLPEYTAKHYEERISQGGVVVGVEARTEDEADVVERDLKDAGAEDVKQQERK